MFSKKNRFSKLFIAITITVTFLFFLQKNVFAQSKLCKFEPTSKISSRDQAKCLLRLVKKRGNLGPTLSALPSTLDFLLGLSSIDLDKVTFRRYLSKHSILEKNIGGFLDQPVSRANNNSSNAELARYFIIHDTSTPNFGDGDIPTNINDSSWSGNKLQRWTSAPLLAHIFVNRIENSVTPVDFSTPWRATGYEVKFCGQPCKGLFLSVEMIQPRRSDPRGSGNDAVAPNPGFTDAQLDRLAIVYIAASIRRGKWMIPAFHAAIDAQVYGDHDDPQNFDLLRWDERLKIVLAEIRS